jgi:hypothetical protein
MMNLRHRSHRSDRGIRALSGCIPGRTGIAQERRLDARLLIPLDRLADAAARTADPAELARRLRVDEALLRERLAHLHPAERAQLRRAVASAA